MLWKSSFICIYIIYSIIINTRRENTRSSWYGGIATAMALLSNSSVVRLTLKLFSFYRDLNVYNFRKLRSSSIDCNQWCLLRSKNSFIRQSNVCEYIVFDYLRSLETINTPNDRRFIIYDEYAHRRTNKNELVPSHAYGNIFKKYYKQTV